MFPPADPLPRGPWPPVDGIPKTKQEAGAGGVPGGRQALSAPSSSCGALSKPLQALMLLTGGPAVSRCHLHSGDFNTIS